MNNIYWTTKNGHKILVDDMDIDHLRNTLKMIIRNQAKSVKVQPKNSFELNGDMAISLIKKWRPLFQIQYLKYFNFLKTFKTSRCIG
jgi:hypothetical protein